MTKQRLEKIVNFLIEGLILSIVFLIPLYYSFFYKRLEIFLINPTLERLVIFKILVIVGLFLTLIKLWLARKINFYVQKKYILVILSFLAALIISTLLSGDIYLSFFGSYVRQSGLLAFFYFLFFVILICLNIKERKQIERIVNAVLFSSFFVSLFGILQWLGVDLILRGAQTIPGARVSSTIGQPVFLGNYLLLVIFLSLYKLFNTERFLYKFLAAILFFTQFFCLMFTYSRGAWVGFMSGLFFGGALWLFLNKKRIFKIIITFLFLIILAVGLFGYKNNNIIDLPADSVLSFSQRIKSMFDFESGSVAMRIKYWQGALFSIAEKPFFGYGPDNQRSTLIKYYNPTWLIYEGIESFPDRAHNEYLDILLANGFLGLGSFLFILFFIFWQAIIYLKNKNDWLVFFILTTIFSYQVALQFSFSTIESNLYFWLYMVILCVILSNREEILFDITRWPVRYHNILLFCIFIISIFVASILWNNINKIRADYYYVEARKDEKAGDIKGMINNYSLAMKMNNRERFYEDAYILSLITSETSAIVYEDGSGLSVATYLESRLSDRREVDNNFFKLHRRAIIASILGEMRGSEYYEVAKDYYAKATAINPFVPSVYKNQGLMYSRLGDYALAIESYKHVLSAMPDLNNKYLNEEHRKELKKYLVEIYNALGGLYYQAGDINNAIESYKNILKLDPYYLLAHKALSDVYFKAGNIDGAIWHNIRGYTFDHENYFWSYNLAFLYDKKGDELSALKYAEQADELVDDNNLTLLINKLRYGRGSK